MASHAYHMDTANITATEVCAKLPPLTTGAKKQLIPFFRVWNPREFLLLRKLAE